MKISYTCGGKCTPKWEAITTLGRTGDTSEFLNPNPNHKHPPLFVLLLIRPHPQFLAVVYKTTSITKKPLNHNPTQFIQHNNLPQIPHPPYISTASFRIAFHATSHSLQSSRPLHKTNQNPISTLRHTLHFSCTQQWKMHIINITPYLPHTFLLLFFSLTSYLSWHKSVNHAPGLTNCKYTMVTKMKCWHH